MYACLCRRQSSTHLGRTTRQVVATLPHCYATFPNVRARRCVFNQIANVVLRAVQRQYGLRLHCTQHGGLFVLITKVDSGEARLGGKHTGNEAVPGDSHTYTHTWTAVSMRGWVHGPSPDSTQQTDVNTKVPPCSSIVTGVSIADTSQSGSEAFPLAPTTTETATVSRPDARSTTTAAHTRPKSRILRL